jgi:hypothetical protein
VQWGGPLTPGSTCIVARPFTAISAEKALGDEVIHHVEEFRRRLLGQARR